MKNDVFHDNPTEEIRYDIGDIFKNGNHFYILSMGRRDVYSMISLHSGNRYDDLCPSINDWEFEKYLTSNMFERVEKGTINIVIKK